MSRPVLAVLLATLLLAGCNTASQPSSGGGPPYPRRTITIICPWAAGGGTDYVSRFWADAIQKELGKPCVVANRTGGSGGVGHTAGAKARPDGHTLTTITFELSTMHRMGICDLTYRDYECLLQMSADPAAIIVREDAPWQSLKEFLDAIKEKPKTLKMSGTATGGAWDLARVGLLQAAELPIDSVIWVPTEGAAPSLAELLGGHLDAVCCSVPEAASQLEGKQLRALVVMADERLPEFPDVQTAKESGVDWVAVGWRGLALPKETPAEVVAILKEKCLAIANSDEFKEAMQKRGFGMKVRGPEEFTEFLAAQDEQWKAVVEAAGYAKE